MRGKIYLKNAAVLTVTGIILRILGMVFRVYIAAGLGSEGMGLYQLILALYMVFVSLGTAGINIASTNLAAKNLARGRGLRKTVVGLATQSAVLGTIAMVAQFLLAEPLARYVLHDIRAELSLRILAPSLPFMAVAGALRGCFLARRRVNPNAVAQMVEQCVRMGVVYLTMTRFVAWGAAYGCAAVLIGNTVSETVSCLIMLLYAHGEPAFAPSKTDVGRPYTGRELAGIVLPVEGSRVLASGLQATESALIPLCLSAYLGERAGAVAQYGALKGMAMPLIFFPFSILAALSSLLMPEIARAHTCDNARQTEHLVDTMMKITTLFSLLAGAAFVLFGRDLSQLLYHDAQVGEYVCVLGLIAPFMYLESMVDGVLKGLGEQWATFRYSMLDSAFRIGAILLVLPRFGIQGFLGVMVVSNIGTCSLNTARMLLCTHIRPRWWAWLLRPLLFAALAVGAALLVLHRLVCAAPLRLALGGAALCTVYLALAWAFGGIKKAPSAQACARKEQGETEGKR